MFNRNKILSYNLIILLGVLIMFSNCQKEAAIPFEPYQPEKVPYNPTDVTLAEVYQKYQSKIIYKWNDRYFGPDVEATPPKFNLVLPFTNHVIKDLFIEAYDSQEEGFMLKYMPVELILIGSSINFTSGGGESNFNASGLTQGFSRIIVSGINDYDLNNSSWLRKEYATLHHEFAHVLENKLGRPTGFDDISKGKYAGSTSYNVYSQAEAHDRGFWRNYGMSNEREDFATFVEGIVTTPKDEVLDFVNQNNLLKQKYQMVYNFYLNLGIDLHDLHKYLENKLH